MANEKRPVRTGRLVLRSLVLAGGGLVALGLLGGCPSTPAPMGPVTPVTTVTTPTDVEELGLPLQCKLERVARDLFTPLGLQALSAFGRLDPQLYRTSANASNIEVVDTAKALPGRSRGDFDAALAALNKVGQAKELFGRQLEAARASCTTDSCVGFSRTIDVRELDPNSDLPEQDRSKGAELFGKFSRFAVLEGAPPTAVEWGVFFSVYNVDLPGCPLDPAFALDGEKSRSRLDGSSKELLGLMLQGSSGSSGYAHWLTDCEGSSACTGCGQSRDYRRTNSGPFCCGSLC